ncbi:MAG: transcription-repair coupling factor, partial [Pseudomonadales bacterium]|nr:transcription-repair coupling factor [Pseudomonadales bacterium]
MPTPGDLQVPETSGGRRHWSNLPGCGESLAIAAHLSRQPGFCLVITPDVQTADRMTHELRFFLGDHREEADALVQMFPDWETLLYDSFSPHQDIISERLHILNRLPARKEGILVVSATAISARLAPRTFTLGSSLIVSRGEKFSIDSMRRQLESAAYRCVETVFEHGEFAVRGSIMDIFPMGSAVPYRLDLFDDEIDTIRTFDPESQRSVDQIDSITLLPAREFPLTRQAISFFQDQWHLNFAGNPRNCPVYEDVSQGMSPAGIEYYLPLFFEATDSLFDYLPENTLVVAGDIEAVLEHFQQEALNRYENLRHDIQKPILAPAKILLSPAEVFAGCNRFRRLDTRKTTHNKGDTARLSPLPDLSLNDRAQNPLARLQQYLGNYRGRVLLITESAGRREIVDELLSRHGLRSRIATDWQDFLADPAPLQLTVATLEEGVILDDASITVLTEQQLFGNHVLQRRRREKQKDTASELIVKSLTELRINSPVVHIDHGVGRYTGLETLTIDNQEAEFLTLTYQDEARLYVPVSSLHLISRYTGADEALAPLHKLGGDTWEKARKKAAEQIRDVAAELLDIYARREAKKGFAYPPPDESYQAFAAAFPFEETPDQETAIERIISEMVADRAMDHLICGDVGFGKTEVAMRAAFLAVHAGKQVAVLVPTTLLAQQHGETFMDRFADWPVTVESISRFKTKKEQNEVMLKLEAGTVDIVIGTHALLSDKVKFKNLGLVIIDEEHRFGVRQKEKLKSLRAEVDILTMTATPIPRTLNMAMSGVRDLSLIVTPPAKRLSVKTFIRESQDALIKEAVLRELLRGGQVFYLHNEVKTINKTGDHLRELIPEARVGVAHGQLPERELEQIMADFYHKRYNILVCSTIIETGIDIPSANTIIMDRADKLGLAQLHQLRGRVGRSH